MGGPGDGMGWRVGVGCLDGLDEVDTMTSYNRENCIPIKSARILNISLYTPCQAMIDNGLGVL